MLRAPRVKLWLSVTSTPALLLSLLWASSGGWTLALGLPLLILALGAVVARHQVALLRDGLLVYASVTEINQARQTLTLEYQGPYGDPIEIHEPLLGLPQPHQLLGQRLPVLVNPQNFKDRLVPAFYPISFKAPRLVGDTAGRLPAPVASAAQEPPDWETSLWPALPPRLRGDPLARLGVAEPIEGSLRHQAQRLIHRWGHGDPLELDLGQPFSVDLSCSPRGPRRVAVNLRLRGKRAGVDQAALCVRSVLPQSCVRAEVPRKEEAGPWLEEADFWRLWRALGFYAQVHGVEAQRMKQLQAPGHGAT
jgi:hypothetical protein